MISYEQLNLTLLSNHRESYKKTLSTLRKSDAITQEELLSAFVCMQQQGTVIFVALDEKHGIVGSLTLLIEQKMLRNGSIAGHLEDTCVQSSHQGKGIGKTLLNMALKYATEAGCYKVIGDTRDELVPWFKKQGFTCPERMVRKYL